MKVVLEVIKGPETGRVFEFTEPDTFIVGRGRRNKPVHLKLGDDDPYISREHFLLEIAPPNVFLKDLDSANKPCLNGVPVTEARLADGDIIEVGYTQLRVSLTVTHQTADAVCLRCGKPIPTLPDEKVTDYYCADCADEIEDEQRKTLVKPTHTILCRCGADLTAQAHSDGRAEELRGLVSYVCGACAVSLRAGAEAGQRIGSYEVLRLLGAGGMGRAYQVYHPPTARIMALKQMLNLSDQVSVHRFHRETRYLKELRHPNILRFIDSGVSQAGPYLVIEFAAQGDLDDYLDAQGGCLAAPEAVYFMAEVLAGLEFMHQRGIIHRDLKPQNILLQVTDNAPPAPSRLVARIADFGIAKKYSEAGGSLLTQAGAFMGAPLFMPPEQMRDARNVREPADLYSLGVTLYYLLTGKYPYDFPTKREIDEFFRQHQHEAKNTVEAMELMRKIKQIKSPPVIVLSQEPIPIRDRKPDVPPALAQVVDKAIRKDIPARYQTAAEFRAALLAAS